MGHFHQVHSTVPRLMHERKRFDFLFRAASAKETGARGCVAPSRSRLGKKRSRLGSRRSPIQNLRWSPNRNRAQGEARRRAANFVGHADIAKLVGAVLCQLFEGVKLANVDALLTE